MTIEAPAGPVTDKQGRLAAMSAASPSVLELGCGSRRRHAHAITVDALDYPDVDVVGDVYDVLARMPDGSVDAVYSYHFVEHLPDLARFIAGLRRVVRHGGRVLTVVPHFSNPYFYSDYTHHNHFGLYTFAYFSKTRYEGNLDFSVPEFTADIARSMGLARDKKNVPPETMMKVLAVMNSIHAFISGENFFCPMVKVDRGRYIALVKETLKFIHIPAFTQNEA